MLFTTHPGLNQVMFRFGYSMSIWMNNGHGKQKKFPSTSTLCPNPTKTFCGKLLSIWWWWYSLVFSFPLLSNRIWLRLLCLRISLPFGIRIFWLLAEYLSRRIPAKLYNQWLWGDDACDDRGKVGKAGWPEERKDMAAQLAKSTLKWKACQSMSSPYDTVTRSLPCS